jgi:Tfp pilus assembly protein PilX
VLLSTLLCGSPWFNIAFNFLYMKYPQTSQHRNHRSGDAGFALVIALGLMAFVLLLLLSITTLVEVSVRGADAQKQLTLARQNALLGVQVALGQLQTEMGPDRRISATASLLDEDPQTDVIGGVGQPHWTGVWNSLNWDRSSQLNTPVSTLADASDGKPASFRGWLVSGLSDSTLTSEQLIAQARSFTSTSSDAVKLLGAGTLGTAVLAQTESVYVPRQAIVGAGGSLRESGYAYWVGDEGVKARVGNPMVDPPDSNEEKRYAVSALRRPNLQAFKGWSAFTEDDSSVDKVFDYGSVRAVAVEAINDSSAFDGKFHSVTPFSAGLLTDSRMGGLKRDMSLLFSGAALPDAYTDEPVFQFGSAAGVDWGFVKRHHNRYKLLQAESDGTAFLDPLDFVDELKDEKDYFAPSPDMTTYSGVSPAPVVVRFQYVFSLFKGYNTLDGRLLTNGDGSDADPVGSGMPLNSNDKILYLMVTPIVYLWNPYNVAIHMDQVEDGHSALNLLPGEPPIEISLDGGGSYLKWSDIFAGNAGEVFSVNTSNTDKGNGDFVIPPGHIYINTLTNSESIGGPLLTRGSMLSAHNLQGVFGQDHVDEIRSGGEFQWFHRKQYLVAGYDPSRMGFYSPLLKPDTTGNIKDRKVMATGSAEIRIRSITPSSSSDVVKYIFKTSLGGEDKVDSRKLLGVMYMKASGTDAPLFIPEEYNFSESLNLASDDVPDMFVGDEFVGATPHFSLYYDIRSFEEANTLGMPGLFSDPTNGYFYSGQADKAAVAMAPFRLYFETLAGGNLIEYPATSDPSDNLAAFRNASSDLVSQIVAKELPLGPMLSIAQFEHAPLGIDSEHLAYTFHDLRSGDVFGTLPTGSPLRREQAPLFNRAVGNSFAHPMLAAETVWDGDYAVDRSYVLNDLLFDSYFLSGVADQGGPLTDLRTLAPDVLKDVIDGDFELPNSNYKFVVPDSIDTSALSDVLLDESVNESGGAFERLAAFISVEGAFNINSTSTDAWAAMLSSLRGQAVLYADLGEGLREDSNTGVTPVMAQSVPAAASVASHGSDSNALYQAMWSGYRSLTDQQIYDLAEAIVAEVKARGPFLSLGQFVNREISDRSDFNLMGAIQAALEFTKLNSESDNVGLQAALQKRFKANEMTSDELSEAGFVNPDALVGRDVNEGLAGFMTQAEILKPMAPLLTARSDTFIIRSYGDVTNSGEVTAKVWCEAVIQRRSDYVEGAGVRLKPWDLPIANSVEQQFGRQFKLISFRWLSEDEV